MLTAADAMRSTAPITLMGSAVPRIAQPEPLTHRADEYRATAERLGIALMPWQIVAGRYLTAMNGDTWRFREVAVLAGRQNGKTELVVPRIRMDLDAGKRVLHTAHRMRLPRKVFLRVARSYGRDEATIRYAQGQEEIVTRSGGSYVIIAAQRGARGESADTLIYDEVREFEDFDVTDAADPTLTASPDPQRIYLSNAGSASSVVLNDIRRRGDHGGDEELAYLEWSAAPERALGDRAGWAEANPGLGHLPGVLKELEADYRKSGANPSGFETEHLCRWVDTMLPKAVSDVDFAKCRADILDEPTRPAMAFALDGQSTRCSAALSWRLPDGRIALVALREYRGNPLDLDSLGGELRKLAVEQRARLVGHSSADKGPARHLRGAKALDGKEYAAACGTFASLVASGRLAWDGDPYIAEDLAFTARRPYESGWIAEPATAERPVPAALAAIRATYLASAPASVPRIG